MCPACVSTLVLIAAGAGATGGLTATIASKLRGKNDPEDVKSKARVNTPEQKEQPQ